MEYKKEKAERRTEKSAWSYDCTNAIDGKDSNRQFQKRI
jgi:hypothetical protein